MTFVIDHSFISDLRAHHVSFDLDDDNYCTVTVDKSHSLYDFLLDHCEYSYWSLLFNSFLMTPLFELRRVVYRATEPGVEDITQLLGCYSTLDEADVARDQYRDRYPMSSLYIE